MYMNGMVLIGHNGSRLIGDDSNDWFGINVAISDDGTVIAISASRNPGYVKIYEYDTNTSDWVIRGSRITATSDKAFGRFISMNGTGSIIRIGSPDDDLILKGSSINITFALSNIDITGIRPGSAGLVFRPGSAGLVNSLSQPNGSIDFDEFGHDVSLSNDGTRFAVSSIQTYNNNDDYGKVSIFEINESGIITQLGNEIVGTSNGGQFGNGISLSADGIFVSIVESNAFASSGSGSIFQYIPTFSNWNQNIIVDISNICFLGNTYISCDQGNVSIEIYINIKIINILVLVIKIYLV